MNIVLHPLHVSLRESTIVIAPFHILCGLSLHHHLHSFVTPLCPMKHRVRMMPGEFDRPLCQRKRERERE